MAGNFNGFNNFFSNFPGSGKGKAPQDPLEQKQSREDAEKAMKKAGRGFLLFVLLFVLLGVASQFFYMVDEREHAIQFRFNKIVGVDVNNLTAEELSHLQNDPDYQNVQLRNGAGLRFKLPFVDKIEKFNNQLITYDTTPREVITADKKKMILDNNAQWWIVDPVKFKITMNSVNSANMRIEDLMYSKMNEKIGRTTATQLISDREHVMKMLEDNAAELNEMLAVYGITVADIQIKRTDFPEENNSNIYNRMRTEREQMARQYRSEGKEEAQKIRSTADKEAARIRAEANAEAQRIRGKGDADAAKIFNEAYRADPEFYEFYKTLEMYKSVLPESGAKIVLSPDSDFAQYLYGAGEGTAVPAPPSSSVEEASSGEEEAVPAGD